MPVAAFILWIWPASRLRACLYSTPSRKVQRRKSKFELSPIHRRVIPTRVHPSQSWTCQNLKETIRCLSRSSSTTGSAFGQRAAPVFL